MSSAPDPIEEVEEVEESKQEIKKKRYRALKESRPVKKKRVAKENVSREDIEINNKSLKSQDEIFTQLKEGLDNLTTTMQGLLPSIELQLTGSFGPLIDRINELGAQTTNSSVVPFPDPNEKFGRIQEPVRRYDLINN